MLGHLTIYVTIATLVSARICPDGSLCSDDGTCCETGPSQFGCCPLADAVCCSDHEHCCPSGYTCSEGLCYPAEVSQPSGYNVSLVCPGGGFTCPDGSTCCPAGDVYTCCPLPDATCCSDGLHCCPGGTTCDLAHETCNVPIVQIASTVQRRRPPMPKQLTVVVCPGGEFQCPDDSTCCLMESGDYGCCPLPNAVCCDDRIHCCPTGYTCNGGSCSRVQDTDLRMTTVSPVALPVQMEVLRDEHENDVEAVANYVDCPDGTSKCPDGNTCCMLSSGAYGCCPLPDATCCSDHIHCCPHGSTCDVSKGSCQAENLDVSGPDFIPWTRKVPAIPRNKTTNE